MEGLKKSVAEKSSVINCGLHSLLDPRTCSLSTNPFWTTYVGVKREGWGGNNNEPCKLESKVNFSPWMLGALVSGLFIFYAAPILASSLFFRISSGSVLFTLGSLLILLFIIMRNVPHKGKVMAALGVMGSTGLAALKWFTGQWLPSWTQLSHNPFFQWYVVSSLLIGAALSYWFDDSKSTKMNTLIQVTLRLSGLILIYYSTWMVPVAFAGVAGILLTSLISPKVQEETRAHVVKAADVTGQVLRRMASPFTSPLPSIPSKSKLAKRGSVSAQATPLSPLPPPSSIAPSPPLSHGSGGGGGGWGGFWTIGSAGASSRKREEDRMRAELGLPPLSPLDGLRPRIEDIIPFHLKTPPPDPWALKLSLGPANNKREPVPFEDKMKEALLKDKVGGSSPARSGKKKEKITTTAPPAENVAAGYIFNPATGRTIKIGGDTFLKLIEAGWRADLSAGQMVSLAVDKA